MTTAQETWYENRFQIFLYDAVETTPLPKGSVIRALVVGVADDDRSRDVFKLVTFNSAPQKSSYAYRRTKPTQKESVKSVETDKNNYFSICSKKMFTKLHAFQSESEPYRLSDRRWSANFSAHS
jgi:hypothetical protein